MAVRGHFLSLWPKRKVKFLEPQRLHYLIKNLQRRRSFRRKSAAAHLLKSWVRIPLGHNVYLLCAVCCVGRTTKCVSHCMSPSAKITL